MDCGEPCDVDAEFDSNMDEARCEKCFTIHANKNLVPLVHDNRDERANGVVTRDENGKKKQEKKLLQALREHNALDKEQSRVSGKQEA